MAKAGSDRSIIIPVVLCGGAGTRLWPVSNANSPKQFLCLSGERTLLRETAERARRVADLAAADPLVAVTLARHAARVGAELAQTAPAASCHVLEEPSARGTAAAILHAALHVRALWGDTALLWILPSDHDIADEKALAAALETAVSAAKAGYLTTFGIPPSRPETGYGYIRAGAALPSGGAGIDRFREKPDAAAAKEMLEEGGWLWNSGMFLCAASALLDESARCAPDITAAVTRALKGSQGIPGESLYAAIPSASFDRAVMERTEKAAVIPCDPGWSDIGSWDSVRALLPADENGNAASGRVLLRDARNCLVRAQGGRVVACAGVSDLVIIETHDAVLVAGRNAAAATGALAAAREAADGGAEYRTRECALPPGSVRRYSSGPFVMLTAVTGGGTVVAGAQSWKLTAGLTVRLPENGAEYAVSNDSATPLVFIEITGGPAAGRF